jgi:hypothetical protein
MMVEVYILPLAIAARRASSASRANATAAGSTEEKAAASAAMAEKQKEQSALFLDRDNKANYQWYEEHGGWDATKRLVRQALLRVSRSTETEGCAVLVEARKRGQCDLIFHSFFRQQTQDGTFGTPAFLEFEETGETG